MTPLRKERLKKGWSMVRLAKEAGISYSALSRHECGWTRPGRQTAARVAQALGVPVAGLFPEAPSENGGHRDA